MTIISIQLNCAAAAQQQVMKIKKAAGGDRDNVDYVDIF